MATPKTSRTQQGTAARAAGFALIATISMMSLVVVLTLGLLALSVSATRQHAASREGSIAQANARLALAMALGDLQKFYGPVFSVPSIAGITLEHDLTDTEGAAVAWSTDPSIPVAAKEYAVFSADRIVVVL